MDEVKKGRLPAAILFLTLIVGLLAAGCGQKEMEPPKHELAGKELAELSAWPERETYDEAFHDSRNAGPMDPNVQLRSRGDQLSAELYGGIAGRVSGQRMPAGADAS